MANGETKAGMSGLLFKTSARGRQFCFISWHNVTLGDVQSYRIWVTSAQGEHNNQFVTGIEMQMQPSGFTAISEAERKARLNLASMASSLRAMRSVSAEEVRGIQSGKLLEMHSRLISQFLAMDDQSKPLKLVSEQETQSMPLSKIESAMQKHVASVGELRSTKGDALYAAAIYSYLGTSGSSKLAKRTAEFLGVDLVTVYSAIRVARANKWLTANAKGVSGGRITDNGLEALFISSRYDDVLAALNVTKQEFDSHAQS